MPVVQCKICFKDFYIKPSHQILGWGKYCSIYCRSKAQFNGRNVKCFVCNKEIYRSDEQLRSSKSGKYFCNKKCQTLWRNSIYIEDRGSNWINGSCSYRKMMQRRDLIDSCVLCKVSDKRVLVIHHRDHDRKNNNISNLVCVCLNCHFLIHHDKSLNDKLKDHN